MSKEIRATIDMHAEHKVPTIAETEEQTLKY
jgi:hypothetical protein